MNETKSNQNSTALVDKRFLFYLYILMGIIMIMIGPLSFVYESVAYNYSLIGVVVAIGVIMVIFGVLCTFLDKKKMKIVNFHMLSLLSAIFGILLFFFFASFYAKPIGPIQEQYHLYIISMYSDTYHTTYKVRDLISEDARIFGILFILGGLYIELYERINNKKFQKVK
ncbi:hypothetical protein [Caldiplasma sukawensis]